jgi:hypothetical protein
LLLNIKELRIQQQDELQRRQSEHGFIGTEPDPEAFQGFTQLSRDNQSTIIRYLFRNGVLMERFDVGFEMSHFFMDELHEIKYLPSIDYLVDKLRISPYHYELKL